MGNKSPALQRILSPWLKQAIERRLTNVHQNPAYVVREHRSADFLSDVVLNEYSSSSVPRIASTGLKKEPILNLVGADLKPNRSWGAFGRQVLARLLLAVLLYLLQAGPLLIADEEDAVAKLSSLDKKVTELYEAGKFTEAIPIAQEAVELSEKALGPDHPDTALALSNLARLYKSLGDYAKAGPLLKRAQKIGDRRHGGYAVCLHCGARNVVEGTSAWNSYRCPVCGTAGYPDIEPVQEYQEAMPKFPWPPPKASASDTVSRELLLGSREHPLLGDVAAALELAFRKAGYGERSFYGVPGGFAMASRIEQMNRDGTSLKDPADRWSLKVPPIRKFSFSAYMTALFRARPGYYRVIVFVVTSHPFSQSGAEITSDDAKRWLSSGLNALPDDIASRDYTSAYRCTALIYEFKRTEGKHAEFVDPSEVTGQIHLEKAGLLAALKPAMIAP
jgi:hypothetical protein